MNNLYTAQTSLSQIQKTPAKNQLHYTISQHLSHQIISLTLLDQNKEKS